MKKFKEWVGRFIADESGVTAVEYGVLAVLVVGAITAASVGFADALGGAFTTLAGHLNGGS